MIEKANTLRLAAVFVFLSAALHIGAPVVGGFTSQALMLIPYGILFALIGLGLLRGMRWLAWITFFGTLIGGIAALNGMMGLSAVPGWWYALIMTTDWLAAAILLIHLWRPKKGHPAAA